MISVAQEIDAGHLLELGKKFQVVRDRVAGVAMHYTAGCIITGRGGTGKSWTAIEELASRKVPYVLHNTHVTPRTLFDELDGKARELEVAREITGLARRERLQVWQERTGKSEAALYRRLTELGRTDAQGHGS